MSNYDATGNYYTIGHIVQFTGLSDRTIRSYIAAGLLQGEKINGLWHFTSEQVDAFMAHPSVRPCIQAKGNAIVYDFMLDRKKQAQELCAVLDLPGKDREEVSQFFCQRICEGDYHDLKFSFNSIQASPRVILKGRPAEVLELLNAYYEWNP